MDNKKCRHCKSEIPADAKVCPVCRKKQGKKVWPVIIGVILVLGVIGSMGNSGNQQISGDRSSTAPTQAESRRPEYEITRCEIETDGLLTYISGSLVNNTSRQTNYLQITFNLYDEDGALIGSAMDNINYLDAGGVWKFKALAFEDDFASYELAEVTGF